MSNIPIEEYSEIMLHTLYHRYERILKLTTSMVDWHRALWNQKLIEDELDRREEVIRQAELMKGVKGGSKGRV